VYLEDVVSRRGHQHKKREDGMPCDLSFESYSMEVKALIDLHSTQVIDRIAEPGKIRGTALQAWLKNKRIAEHKRKREEYVDRGAHSAQDGYSAEQLVQVSMFFFGQKKEISLRDRAWFLLQHMMLLRSESSRDIDLADLCKVVFPDEGFSECPALVVRLDHGKTNKFGKVEFGGAIRHKDHRVCAFGALAQYFFYRWHISGEEFPNFEKNATWFDVKAFKNGHPENAMTYRTQLRAVNRVFEALNIRISKKTHSGRGSGAQLAEIDGATEEDLRRHGRWETGSMEKCYLLALPRKSIRIINGFSSEKGFYWLPRANLDPPESLQKKIFPQVEEWLNKVTRKLDGTEYSICAEAFLNLLATMRRVFLQDSVLHRVDHPDHPLFWHDVFSDPEFITFEQQLLSAINTAEEPQDLLVRRALPVVSEQLQNLSNKIDSNQAIIRSMISQQQATTSADSAQIASVQQDVGVVKNHLEHLKLACAYFVNPHGAAMVSNAGAPSNNNGQNHADTTSTYRLDRNVQSLADLVKEWFDGLPPSKPSVVSLNAEFGSSWRSDQKGKTC
jgi:hypothetical protein